MSGFIRPEMTKWFTRWREPILAGILMLIGLRFLWRGVTRYNWVFDGIGIVLLLIGLAVFWASFRRLQFRADEDGPGLVEVTERQITFLSALGGGSVDIEAMTRLELRTNIGAGRVWVLKQSEGPTLFIPITASGTDKLFDAFAALPGIDMAHVIAAVKTQTDKREVVWRGSPKYRALT
jgi:hypothetical protein